MVKLLVGLLKGAVIGGALGYGAYQLFGTDLLWLTCGLACVFVGLVVGRPIWSLIRDKNATSWISVIKAAFGFGVGVGLWAIVAKAWQPSFLASIGRPDILVAGFAGVIGGIYGGFVELDDSLDDKSSDKPKQKRLEK